MIKATNRRNNIAKKYYIKGKLRLLSPTIVASGDDQHADLQCMRDWAGNLIIPATSIAGTIRHHLVALAKDPAKIEQIFGSSEENATQSCFSFYDALPLSKNIKTDIRDGVKLDYLTKTTEKTGKYDYEVVVPDNLFSFRMEVTVRSQDDEAELIKETINFIVNQLKIGEITLGAKATRGFGKVQLEDVQMADFDLANKEELESWVNFDWDSSWHEAHTNFDSTFVNYKEGSNEQWEVNFQIPYSFIIKMANRNIEGSDAVSLTSNGKPVISGTSWNGAIRHALINAGRELGREEKMKELVDQLFGFVNLEEKRARKSRIHFSESYIEDYHTAISHHNKVDRFTGGVVDGALFDEEPLYGGKVTLKVEIEKPECYEKGLLLLAFKELQHGIQTVGGNSNIGRGRLESDDIKFSAEEERSYFSKLATELQKEV